MSDWKALAEATKNLLKENSVSEAKVKIEEGLQKIPNQLNLLFIATDVYRASGDREKSLDYAELLSAHYPDNWNGYGRAAQDLVAMSRFDEAKVKIEEGLQRIPNQLQILTIATDVYRASDEREKSLGYAELLSTHYPDNWNGYARAAQDLVALTRFDEAKVKIEEGLQKIPNQFKLLSIATNIYRASGDREKSLGYAELLSAHYPGDWHGYGRAAQDLVALTRFDEAKVKIEEGLQKIPNQLNLLTIATDVYRASGDREKSLEYAKILLKNPLLCNNEEEDFRIASGGMFDIELRVEYASARSTRNQQKIDSIPRLYILAGCSGSGKSTLLHSCNLNTKKIFSPSANVNKIKQLTQKEIYNSSIIDRRLAFVAGSYDRAMMFGTYFSLGEISRLSREKILPKEVLWHVDLRNLFFSRQLSRMLGVKPMNPEEFMEKDLNNEFISNFLSHEFFSRFESIAVATLVADFNVTSKRLQDRDGSELLPLGSGDPEGVYNEMHECWLRNTPKLKPVVDKIIRESGGYYNIFPRDSCLDA